MYYTDAATGLVNLVWRDLTPTGASVSETLLQAYPPGTLLVSVGSVRAPNRDNSAGKAYILYAIINNIRIDSYLVRLTVGGPEKEGLYILRPPLDTLNRYLIDDEFFVAGDREPYLAVTVANTTSDTPLSSEIWVMTAFPSGAPLYRRVTRRLPLIRQRQDPEPLVTDAGTFIYYRDRKADGTMGDPSSSNWSLNYVWTPG